MGILLETIKENKSKLQNQTNNTKLNKMNKKYIYQIQLHDHKHKKTYKNVELSWKQNIK